MIKVEVQHDVMRCSTCKIQYGLDHRTCPNPDCDGERLVKKIVKATILVDDENLDNVQADPAFVRVVGPVAEDDASAT